MYRGKIVESGPAATLFEDPRHPYTLKLLSAVPDINGHAWLSGSQVDQSRNGIAQGCLYGDDCPAPRPECRGQTPGMVKVGPDHYVRCSEIGDHIERLR